MDDNRIIKFYFDRNERAITETERKYGPYCQTIAENILQNKEDAKECVNDTWLKAWNCIPPTRPTHLCTFLGKITRHLAIDRYRRENCGKRIPVGAHCAMDELSECFSDRGTPQEALDAKQLGEALNRFLGTLKKRERDIFLCYYYFLWSTQAIAQKQGLRENYVRNLISRTRKKLKIYLEQEGFSL